MEPLSRRREPTVRQLRYKDCGAASPGACQLYVNADDGQCIATNKQGSRQIWPECTSAVKYHKHGCVPCLIPVSLPYVDMVLCNGVHRYADSRSQKSCKHSASTQCHNLAHTHAHTDWFMLALFHKLPQTEAIQKLKALKHKQQEERLAAAAAQPLPQPPSLHLTLDPGPCNAPGTSTAPQSQIEEEGRNHGLEQPGPQQGEQEWEQEQGTLPGEQSHTNTHAPAYTHASTCTHTHTHTYA